jgi:hypothetical protein
VATRTLRKDLRRPDEFVTGTAKALEYAQTHQRTVAWIGAVIVGLILLAVAFSSFRHQRWQQANANLARGMALFNENKLPEAIKAFDEMASQPSNPENFVEIARLYSAQAQLKQGEFARAVAAFDAAQGGVDGFLEQRAVVNHAFALEGNQQFAEAAATFHNAARAGGPYTAVAVLGEARNWDRSGDAAKAKEAYQKYVSDYPDAPEKAVAEARLAALSS